MPTAPTPIRVAINDDYELVVSGVAAHPRAVRRPDRCRRARRQRAHGQRRRHRAVRHLRPGPGWRHRHQQPRSGREAEGRGLHLEPSARAGRRGDLGWSRWLPLEGHARPRHGRRPRRSSRGQDGHSARRRQSRPGDRRLARTGVRAHRARGRSHRPDHPGTTPTRSSPTRSTSASTRSRPTSAPPTARWASPDAPRRSPGASTTGSHQTTSASSGPAATTPADRRIARHPAGTTSPWPIRRTPARVY